MDGGADSVHKPKPEIPLTEHPDQPTTPVRIVDINMPFTSMVTFMVKWAFASIPAMIIVAVLAVVLLGAVRAVAR
jgi:hypothetical protein